MEGIPFTEEERRLGRLCLRKGQVHSVIFSEGTYQFEIEEGGETCWPFLQITDKGKVLDSFCSCMEDSFCPHIVASYYHIFSKGAPLHERFRSSFWRAICFMASDLHGYRADTLVYDKGWKAFSLSGEEIFALHPKNKEGEERLKELLEERPVETEETSLKFSGLSEKELALYRAGKPSASLQFTLSFWGDLAMWLFEEDDDGKKIQVSIIPNKGLPQKIEITNEFFLAEFHIPRKALPELIPSFKTVDLPLKVFDAAEALVKAVSYDEKEKAFYIECLEEDNAKEAGEEVGGYLFVEGKGFFQKEMDPILYKGVIPTKEIDTFLSNYSVFLQKHLKEEIHTESISLEYQLELEDRQNLCIKQYLFEPGDLKEKGAALFKEWVYLPEGGFYHVDVPRFSSIETKVPKEDISSFFKKHKTWLQTIEGFAVHPTCIESDLNFSVDEKGSLRFSVANESGKEVVHLNEWVFVAGRGFFPKQEEGVILEGFAGTVIKKAEVASFIRQHKEELETLPSFFLHQPAIDKVGLSAKMKEGGIVVSPLYTFLPSLEKKRKEFFSEYIYIEGEGFVSPPLLPKEYYKYLNGSVLTKKQEKHFLEHLPEISPWIVEIDQEIEPPKELMLKVLSMEGGGDEKVGQWFLEIAYTSKAGEVPLYAIWEALMDGNQFLVSPAGLLDLSKERFDWIRVLTKKRFSVKGTKVRLHALEWIKVQSCELVILPEGTGKKEQKTRDTFNAFVTGESLLPLEAGCLKSQLRNYQKLGLKWLWFLYGYGLSGLLCDEMGLGKTHQAMALLSAVFERKKGSCQFFVVCPTSVIYHWEELLRVFLPGLRVLVYYGQGRKRESLEGGYDILLTSYGIVRSDKKLLSQRSFEVAIYDEIQNVKNHLSKTHKALKSMQTAIRVGLTGTPIENRLSELKALFDLVLPRYLPSDAAFKEQFILPIEKERSPERKEHLSKVVKPFILRRKKSEVLSELPAKVEEISYCDLSDDQREMYQQLVQTYKREITSSLVKDNHRGMHIFALFSKLKQVCDHPALITGEVGSYEEYSSGKWDLFVELLQEARESKQKVVVFTQYLHMMDIIIHYLRSQHIGFAQIRGSTRDRRSEVVRFQTDPSCEVFIGSLQAAGVGIDLTAASVVIHYDRWWNPAKENQATDRVHRIGQSRGVQVFKLVVKKTIEDRIHELIEKKKGLLDEVVGFDEQDVIKSLSREELFDLFSSLDEDMG